jgi:MFS family permease
MESARAPSASLLAPVLKEWVSGVDVLLNGADAPAIAPSNDSAAVFPMTDKAIVLPSSKAVTKIGREDFKVIAASSFGTVFELFDFFLYSSLAVVLSRLFFAGVDENTAFTFALLTFAAGLAVRPLGALLFGLLGDRWGRKNTVMVALSLMGFATFIVGLLPTYAQIGATAPWLLVACRMLQGLSVGGVFTGAAIYVAEHAPPDRRGFYTSFIQTTGTLGMALSLVVVFGTRTVIGETQFDTWGWRVPFILSALLLGVTIWIQAQLNESPVYVRMKSSGKSSQRPWAESFGQWKNSRVILIALGGALIGQAVIWYAAELYTLFFLERVLKVDGPSANILMVTALIIHMPLYVFFGWLTDKVGRKKIMLAACLLAAVTYFPLFKALTVAANPQLAAAVRTAPVFVYADNKECSFQFDPIGRATFSTSCDVVRSFLTRAGVTYSTQKALAGTIAELRVGGQTLTAFDGTVLSVPNLRARRTQWEASARAMLSAAGYPAKADSNEINSPVVVLILLVLMGFAAMIFGPMAALLVELFPARIRATSLSLPYHIASGLFGGFLPTVAFAIVAETGSIYSGLWYPTLFALSTFVVGSLFLPETKGRDINL